MPGFIRPSRSDVHVNRPLTQISIAYMQMAAAFIASRVFPNISVSNQSDAYFVYPRGEFNRDDMKERPPGTESAGGTYKVGTETYYSRVFAYHKDVPDQIRANQDSPINLDREATEFVTLKGLIKRERTWVDKFFKGGVWSFDIDGAAARSAAFSPSVSANNDLQHWNDAASTPIEDIRLVKRFMQESTGFRPNVLVLGRAVFDTLLDHGDIVGRLDRGQTTGTAVANKDSLAALFELERIEVMDAVYNTAKEGAADSHSFIGGKHALLAFVPGRPGLMTPAAGYTFGWNGYLGAGPEGNRISRFRMDSLKSDRVENELAYDQKLIASDLGAFFEGIVQ